MPSIVKDLATGVTRTDFEVEAEEYHAIGRVTVQWAYLEHGVFAVTYSLAHRAKEDVPSDALSTSFKRRLRAMRLAAEEWTEGDERKRLLKTVSKIANAEQDRHRITHGMWEWDRENPDRISASSFRPGFEFEKAFDAQKINQLADKIGEISFSMEYPEGIRGVLQSHADEDGNVAFAHTSRQLVRAFRDPEYRDRLLGPPTKTQED